MIATLWVALGSAIGGVLRFWCSELAAHLMDDPFPWGTVLINIVGSFVIAFFGTLSSPDGRLFVAPQHRQFVMAGICGGFTTFSSFSLQTLTLAQDGYVGRAGLNVLVSVVMCLLSAYAGYAAAAAINQLKGS